MSTPTLIRVKRRINEDPSDILVLSAKRSRTSESITASGDGDNVRLLKLAGTVENSNEDSIASIVKKKNLPNFEELKKQYKKSNRRNSTKERAQAKNKDRVQQRYRVVNANRSIQEGCEDAEDQEDKTETDQHSLFHIYDVLHEKEEKETDKEQVPAPERLSCNGVEMIREYRSTTTKSEEDYVYDLYFAEEDDFGDFNDSLLDGLVSIQPFCFGDADLMYDEYREDPEEFKYDDDEDSNEEDFRGNEYPDEDEFSDESDLDYSDQLDLGLDRLRVTDRDGSGEDLSSDEEDQLVYTQSFNQVADKHGFSYAKYKAKMMRELQESDRVDDSDSDDDDQFH